MPRIKAFNSYLVKADRAINVVSPAYDSVSPEQRREFAEANPENFINTMRLQEDFPEARKPTYKQLLGSNKERLTHLLGNGSYEALHQPCMFLYQLGSGEHIQIGIVCEVAVSEYEQGKLRKHENTSSAKEDLLAQYQEVVGASSSPICLAYAQNPAIDRYIGKLSSRTPDLDFVTNDGEIQRVWCINDPDELEHLRQLFADISATYLTDGHHRAASGRRYAELMRNKHNSNHGDEPYNQLLVALFPDNQLNLLPFHRCVKDMNSLDTQQLLTALNKHFKVEPVPSAVQPDCHGEFGMLIEGNWYRLTVKSPHTDNNSPVNCLDVSILQNLVLDPVFGIKDMRDDPRLGYIAGVSGIEGINQTVSEGWEVVFTCNATSIQQLMDVADADALMPPKSTYFDPKPRSGIFVRIK